MFNIVMVCTGNICRSPMAERLLIKMLPEDLRKKVSVKSAGTHALHGHQAAEPAVEVLGRMGVDLSDHRARQLSREIVDQTDLLLAMEHHHLQSIKSLRLWGRAKARLLGEFKSPDHPPEIEDPYGQPIESYQACVDALKPCLQGVVAWLKTTL
jgi:protein-tyrosine phosphatase